MLLAFLSSDLGVALALGFAAGIFLFFKGFRVYREYRVLADTPEGPIRSISMGLVRVHGKAKGEQPIPSPVTHTPCLFYKVDIEAYKKDSRGNGGWSHVATDAEGPPFYLEDTTGKVLVDARGAEYDLIENGKRETRASMRMSFGKLFSGMDSPAPATAAAPTDEALVAYAQTAVARRGKSSFTENLGNLGSLRSMSIGSVEVLGGGNNSDRYRLTEYCILPEHWYDVTGSCVENPAPKGERDRNMILKGQNEPTFLISWRSAKAVEATLRKRAALSVLGGAALSLGCLAALLVRFGWF